MKRPKKGPSNRPSKGQRSFTTLLNAPIAAICIGGSVLSFGLLPARAIAQTTAEATSASLPADVSTGIGPSIRPGIERASVITAKPPLSKPGLFRLPTPVPADSPATSPERPPTAAQEEPVRLVLRIGERRVYVYRGEIEQASYPVAVGKSGWETPTGEFEVFSMVSEPGWTNPFTNEVVAAGPDSPLGDRWIAFWTDGENQIGFHGTPNRNSVGQAASHGCVRMYNENIKELFENVEIGTPVAVVP
ncbi:MAG: L,D-transpeptidase family protein [Phormidesmis sp.]